MSLPKKLERLVEQITTQSDVERKLLRTLKRKLESSLAALRKAVDGDCAEGCYEHLINSVFRDPQAVYLDQYEHWVERCVAAKLGRGITEEEEMLIGEIVTQVTGITEVLLTLGGMTLIEEEDQEEEGVAGHD